uniref:Uncharacterized protein n=1 Tax=Gadus morhua TaxID=8049 RepID=A0A8C5BXH6_GADMO
DSAMSALSSASSISCCSLNKGSSHTHPGLQFLDLLLSALHSNLLSFIQAVLEVLDGLFHVLLHALHVRTGVLLLLQLFCHHGSISNSLLGLVPTASLSLQGALKSIHHSLLIAFGLLHLFILLGQFALNLSLHLVELQLSPKDFALLMLERPLKSKSVTYFQLIHRLQIEKDGMVFYEHKVCLSLSGAGYRF